MGAIGAFLVIHCTLYLLQMVPLSSEKFTVTGLTRPVLAPFGGTLELTCQLSPPQHAQHMEIRWFRNRYTQPVSLYREGKDLYGEIIPKYVERTELLKDDIGEGKVTLRIFRVTVDDDGPYHCVFKDGEFYEEHITEVKVTATSSDIQILLHPPHTKGVMLECHARGLFPLPHMEWRDSKGEIIPETSKSHSQDENKLFNMTMTLLIEASTHQNVTCYLQNLLTHQRESISIVLSGELFSWKSVWMWILGIIASVMIAYLMTSCVPHNLIRGKTREESWPNIYNMQFEANQSEGDQSEVLNFRSTISSSKTPPRQSPKDLGNFFERFFHWLKGSMVLIISMSVIIGVMLILHLKQRVPISDPHFELDTLWLEDISVILCVLIVFNIKFVSFIYFKLEDQHCTGHGGNRKSSKEIWKLSESCLGKACVSGCEQCSCKLNIIVKSSQFLCFIVFSVTILLVYLQLQKRDPSFPLYNSWLMNTAMVVTFLVIIFIITFITLFWTQIKSLCKTQCITPTDDKENRQNKQWMKVNFNLKTPQKKGKKDRKNQRGREHQENMAHK